jgi:hypothetical protein
MWERYVVASDQVARVRVAEDDQQRVPNAPRKPKAREVHLRLAARRRLERTTVSGGGVGRTRWTNAFSWV